MNLNSNQSRNSYLFLRHLLAFLVLLSHVFGSTTGYGEIKIGKFSLGTLAVYCFFTVSGFLVIPGLLNNGLNRYLLNRFVRVYPGYLLTLLITSVFIYPIWRFQSHVTIFDWPTSIFYILENLILMPQGATDINSSWNSLSGYPFLSSHPSLVNGSIWTLPLEISAYLFLGILYAFGVIFKTFKFKRVVKISFVALWAISIISANIFPSLDVKHYSQIEQLLTKWPYFLSFLTGAVLRLVNFKSLSRIKVYFLLFIVAISCQSIILWAVIGLCSLCILILHIGNSSVFVRYNKFRDISYGIYLYHFPVIQILEGFEIFDGRLGLNLFFTFLITIIFAYLSSRIVESPCQSYVKKRLDRNR
jgi:peptidoglycan/LPS O-acetylase OafA/YrhL